MVEFAQMLRHDSLNTGAIYTDYSAEQLGEAVEGVGY